MKKILRSLISLKAVVLSFAALMSCHTAMAGDDQFHWFYDAAEAYPTGAGLVYIDVENTAPAAEDYAPAYEVQYYINGFKSQSIDLYAKPAEGYLFAGWATNYENVDISFENPHTMSVNSITATDTEEPEAYPLFPDTTVYALFARTIAVIAENQDALGNIECSKVCNELGDIVDYNAIPTDMDCQFAYWTCGDKVIEENPIQVEVSGNETYVAHFTSTYARTIKFPEEGGWMAFYDKRWARVPTGVSVYSVNYECMNGDTINFDEANYGMYGKTCTIVYGKGEKTFVFDKDETENENASSYLTYTGETGISLDTLDKEHHKYYLPNFEKGYFETVTTNFIEPNSALLALPDTCGTTADIIYFGGTAAEKTTGITTVTADKNEKVSAKGIFDITGRKLAAPKNGVIIQDGRKMFFKK